MSSSVDGSLDREHEKSPEHNRPRRRNFADRPVRPDLATHQKFDPILSFEEAENYTRRSHDTLRLAIQSGALACIREGRRGWISFRLSHLNAYLQRFEQRAKRSPKD